MNKTKRHSLILSSLLLPALLFSQIPTNVDVDTDSRDIGIWDNPWYVVGLIAIVVVAVLLIRWSRKR